MAQSTYMLGLLCFGWPSQGSFWAFLHHAAPLLAFPLLRQRRLLQNEPIVVYTSLSEEEAARAATFAIGNSCYGSRADPGFVSKSLRDGCDVS